MQFCGTRCLNETYFSHAACLLLYFVVFGVSLVSCQPLKKINGLDCTDETEICGANGKCVAVEQERWIDSNSTSRKLNCRCGLNWHGDYCSVCVGRFSLTSESGTLTDGSGNYSSNTNCTWLLNPEGHSRLPIKLNVTSFSTECGWDHLYIHDGTSFDSPLVAVLSGYIPDSLSYAWSSLTLSSGSGYFYFASDSEFNMPGFRIDYSMKESAASSQTSYAECSETCSENGFCSDDGVCNCNSGWKGMSCSVPACPNNCSYPFGVCNIHSCSCVPGFRGDDCSKSKRRGYWENILPLNLMSDEYPKVTSHKSLLVDNDLLIIGGYSFTPQTHLGTFMLNLESNEIRRVGTSVAPPARYGHAADSYEGTVYVCGGALEEGSVSDELWSLSSSFEWRLVESSDGSRMIAAAGHSVHIINGVLFVFFGHSPTLGYLNFVQKFNLSDRAWSIVRTSGAEPSGLYGHSSVYDEVRSQVLIHGGVSSQINICTLKDDLISLDLKTFSWKYLSSSGHVKYLHSATLLNDNMYVFGGNTHNDTTVSHGARCFSSMFLVYDVECDEWHSLEQPDFRYNAARYGHTGSAYKGDIYFYGGFNGLVYNDLFKYSLGKCRGSSEADCLMMPPGIKCVFADGPGCIPLVRPGTTGTAQVFVYRCLDKSGKDRCKESRFESCLACVAGGCQWCDGACRSKYLACSIGESSANEEQCKNNSRSSMSHHCSTINNCLSCMQDDNCYWLEKGSKCEDVSLLANTGNKTCRSACLEQTTCENCTFASCMWCLNRKRCIDSNSYVTSFLYGACHEWTIEPHKCQAKGCESYKDCRTCLQNPACGFCNDDGDTGRGKCMAGKLDGPLEPHRCDSFVWNFAVCPLCQCNGHSPCYPDTDECIACQNFTEGRNCERCQRGYWKDPTKDGACTRCDCGDKADTCDQETGACLCRLRGVSGRKCDECDMFHRNIDGNCFYELSLNYLLTFNLSKSDNQHHTEMNMFVSTSPEKEMELHMNCSSKANLTIIIRRDATDTPVLENLAVVNYFKRFTTQELRTHDERNATIFLFVHQFAYPFLIQVSFYQADQLDLFKFFVTFFSCFFSLLMIAFVAWKCKQRYDVYQRNQRHLKEMAEMASRPCGKCFLIVDEAETDLLPMLSLSSYSKSSVKTAVRQKRAKITPIAVETLSSQKAAILSVIIRLPHADEPCALPDQSGLAIASTIVTFGNYGRRSSTDPSSKFSKLKSLGEYNSNAPRLV